MKEDCPKLEVASVPKIVGDDEEIKVPMRLRSAMTKFLVLHNSENTIKTEDIERMDKSGLLNELKAKAEDETIVNEIIVLIHKVYKTDAYVQKEGARISELGKSIKDLEKSLSSQKAEG